MSRPPVPPSNTSPDGSPDPFAGGSGPQKGQEFPTGQLAGRPRGVTVIALVVAAEATALLGAAAWYGYELATGAPVLSFWGAVFTMALLLAFSAWLFAVGHFLFRGYRWTRAASLVAQIFVLTVGFPTLTGGLIWAGLAMLLPALLAIVLLFDKRVVTYASRTGGSAAV
ncbi:hypothetical protein J2X42_000415 [Arthrobacter sp. BE255]|nr:hypothetical protein [Arthrobacter sp. BE255]